ncbi:hypothetical protein RIF29_16344 [Crotalaria pallida]|uniref:HMA domain-containing protein n=1 Tax=Crotalaria pallida TaxID=3830 RepID=A0AAN9FKW8_CROPI
MASDDEAKKELHEVGIKISKGFPLARTSLASMESLSLPLVQEVVLSADMQCEKCQKRIADIITKMNVETESVVVNVLEKKVTLTFRLPTVGKVITRQITPIIRNPLPKVAIIKRIFRSSRGNANHLHEEMLHLATPFLPLPFWPIQNRKAILGTVHSSPLLEKPCCMIMRINVDCDACCRKLRRIILRMKEIETHMIEKQQRRVCVCGRFVPADVAIKIRKKMNRRVEILEIEEMGGQVENEHEQPERAEETERTEKPHFPTVVYPGQVPSYYPTMPMGQCI